MPRIALSYRRADSAAMAGRIFDRLTAHYGENSVFMDIEEIPFGVDFRAHIQQMLAGTDVLVTLIGPNWLGVGTDGAMRMRKKTDPVRMEIEAAVRQGIPIIPLLIDGAKMPDSAVLPEAFGNFAFLNAADVSSGRDFRPHVERLIGAIDRMLATERAKEPHSPAATSQVHVSVERAPVHTRWRTELLTFFLGPLVLLLVGHYLILADNLDIAYLLFACVAAPFSFGFALLWFGSCRAGPAIAMALALGIAGDAGMTLSESLISGDSIFPQDRFEWRDNIQFSGAIALGFILGYLLAYALRAGQKRRTGKA
jgi:TIR domain